MMFGWFGAVIDESESHRYNAQVDLSFRWGMSWFIFSEVMFFSAFFGALFYVRIFTIPDLGLRIDVEPGKTAQVRFVPEKAGTFLFHCDIFCGTGHEEMAGTMVVRPRKEARDGR